MLILLMILLLMNYIKLLSLQTMLNAPMQGLFFMYQDANEGIKFRYVDDGESFNFVPVDANLKLPRFI